MATKAQMKTRRGDKRSGDALSKPFLKAPPKATSKQPAKKKTAEKGVGMRKALTIAAPNMQVAEFVIVGTSPYVQHKFSEKGRQEMHDKQAAGSTAKKGKKREKKDFKAAYEGAKHKSRQGWCGIPAPSFRNGCIEVCRLCGFKMTLAKMSIFVLADGYDATDNTPLVKITKGKPEYHEMPVRLATGVIDLRARPLWKEGWEAKVRLEFDGDQFTLEDVANLMMRVGKQCGIGEGRAYSKNSAGMGWGGFKLADR